MVKVTRLSFSLVVVFGLLACQKGHPANPGPAPVRSAPTERPDAGSRFVAETASAAERAGASTLQIMAFGAVRVGDSIDGFISVPPDRCALVYARGGSSIEDLDLHVFGDDGTQFGADEAPDDLPTLLLCPKAAARLYVAARVAQGQGVVALAMHDLPASHAARVAEASGARNYAQKPRPIYEAWPGLQDQIIRHRNAVGANWVDLRRVALPLDARLPTTLSLSVPKNRCADVFVAPDEGVAEVDVVASDGKGRVFARAQARGSERYLMLCAEDRVQTVSLRLRPHAGQGMAAVVLSSTKSATDHLNIHESVVKHFIEEEGSPKSVGKTKPAFARRNIAALVGTRTSTKLQLDGCARVDLQPDEQLRGAELWVWNSEAHLVAESDTPGASTLFACASGEVRVDASAARRGGQLATSWSLVPLQDEALALFLNTPLAASRLMRRVQLESDTGSLPSLRSSEALSLSATTLTRREWTLSPGSCKTMTLAPAAEAFSIEARVIQESTGTQLDFDQGRHSIRVRACASKEREVSATVELRSLHFPADALAITEAHQLGD